MKTLVRLITLRHLFLEPMRSTLMITGIALGVAVFVGVRSLNETALLGFQSMFSAASQGADLSVEGGRSGLSQSLLTKTRAHPGVEAAAPLLVNFARPAKATKEQANSNGTVVSSRRYLILGLDLISPDTKKVYKLDANPKEKSFELPNPMALAMNPTALIVSKTFAQRENIKIGQSLAFFTSVGRRNFQIVGTYTGDELTAGLGGDIFIMSLPSAQLVFSRVNKVDRILIKLQKGQVAESLAKELAAKLGDGINISRPGQSNERAASMLGSMEVGLTMASLLALLIGQFLIYNTMTTAIVRRRPEIGILRAVGATKKQLALLWLAEAVAYGIIGAIIGMAIGLGVAQLSLGFFSESISNLYEAVDLRTLHVSPLTLALGMLSGPVATTMAALLPVREALLIAPVEAARNDLPPKDPRPLVRRLALLGLSLLFLSKLVMLFMPNGSGLISGAFIQLGLTLGFALCAPWGVVFMTKLARPLMGRILGPAGALAGDNLVKSPLRAGITVAALMVAVGGVLSIASLVVSLKSTVSTWLDNVLTGDLYISASSPLGAQNGTLMDRRFEEILKAYPEVEIVNPMRFSFEDVDDRPALLIAMPGEVFGKRTKVPITAGNLEAARPTLISGRGIVASANFARNRGKSLGDKIWLNTAKGKQAFEITLICIDYSSEHGTLFIDRKVFDDAYQDSRVNTFNIYCRDGLENQDINRLAEKIREQHGARLDLFVSENHSFRASILTTIEDSFRVSYAMELVAIGIALLGVVNTLFAAVLERTREIGVLRAVGASRTHIRIAVVTEAFLLGALSGGFGVVCGFALGHALVTHVTAGAFGWQLPFEWPIVPAVIGATATSILSAFAGLIPAERAASIDIVEALAYE